MIKNNNNIKQMINNFGINVSKIVAIEELSELQKELCKDLRGNDKRKEIKEEICDVYICLQMLKDIYNFSEEEIKEEYDRKMTRNINRIKEKEIKSKM